MGWRIEIDPSAEKELDKLGSVAAKQILTFLYGRLSTLDNPRSIGEALVGSKYGELRKYRVGNYRLIARIEDCEIQILVLQIGHRREVYR